MFRRCRAWWAVTSCGASACPPRTAPPSRLVRQPLYAAPSHLASSFAKSAMVDARRLYTAPRHWARSVRARVVADARRLYIGASHRAPLLMPGACMPQQITLACIILPRLCSRQDRHFPRDLSLLLVLPPTLPTPTDTGGACPLDVGFCLHPDRHWRWHVLWILNFASTPTDAGGGGGDAPGAAGLRGDRHRGGKLRGLAGPGGGAVAGAQHQEAGQVSGGQW
jgi:hypothetical protein